MNILSIFCEIAIRRMPQNLSDHKSTMVQVMAWCRQATSHYLSQCCPKSLSPYGVTRPQWVKQQMKWCDLYFVQTLNSQQTPHYSPLRASYGIPWKGMARYIANPLFSVNYRHPIYDKPFADIVGHYRGDTTSNKLQLPCNEITIV